MSTPAEPLRPVARLKHAAGAALSLLVACAALRHDRQPQPQLLVALTLVLLSSWFFRRGLSELADNLHRGLQLLLMLYGWVALVLLLAMFAAPRAALAGSVRVLLVCQLVLAGLVVVDWAYPVALFNGWLLIVAIAVVAPDGAPLWCAAFMAAAVLALATRHTERRLQEFAITRPAGASLAARPASLACTVLVALQLAILPWFPDLRAALDLALPHRADPGEPINWLGLLLQIAAAIGAIALLVHLLRELIPRRTESATPPPAELEQLFAAPVSAGKTRRVTRLRIFRDARERVVEEYCWLLRRLSRQGRHRPSFQTGEEFCEVIRRASPKISPLLDELTRLFYRARYSEQPMTRAEVGEAHRLTREILAQGTR